MNPQEKLKLEHIAPYLPYGLKCSFDKNVKEENRINTLISVLNINGKPCVNLIHPLSQVKPILRPLSDLAKEIVEGVNGNPIFLDMFNDSDRGILELKDLHTYSDIFTISVNAFNYLLEHHFDVFNLIPKGLAIDINQLKLTDN